MQSPTRPDPASCNLVLPFACAANFNTPGNLRARVCDPRVSEGGQSPAKNDCQDAPINDTFNIRSRSTRDLDVIKYVSRRSWKLSDDDTLEFQLYSECRYIVEITE